MAAYDFTCPECGGHRLEEVMANVTVTSEVVSFTDDDGVGYGEQTNEGGIVDRYQCKNCGVTVAETEDELFEGNALKKKDD